MHTEDSFHQLIERHRNMLWNICQAYRLGSAWETTDAFQEVVCKLWLSLSQLQDPACEEAWVYRVATRTLISLVRKRSNGPTIPLPPDIGDWPSDLPNPMDDGVASLMDLIDRLKEPDNFIVRSHIDGFKYSEIAQVLGMTEDAVAKRYNRSINIIRQQYER